MRKAMGRLTVWAMCALAGGLAALLHAQMQRREPLTPAQQDQIAEAGIDANQRIALYTRFAEEHVQRLEAIGKRSESGRGRRLDAELEDLTALLDELASNLDEYGDRKADLRKALIGLNDALPRWRQTVSALPKDPVAEIARSDASEALNDLADQAKQLAAVLDAYFNQHKDAAGQQWEEPK